MRLMLAVIVLSLCGCAATKDSVCLGKPITEGKTTAFQSVSDAPSEKKDEKIVLHADCGVMLCVIPKPELFVLIEEAEKDFQRAEELQRQIDAAKPKCAELTVTEPSKNKPKPPPIKGERDT